MRNLPREYDISFTYHGYMTQTDGVETATPVARPTPSVTARGDGRVTFGPLPFRRASTRPSREAWRRLGKGIGTLALLLLPALAAGIAAVEYGPPAVIGNFPVADATTTVKLHNGGDAIHYDVGLGVQITVPRHLSILGKQVGIEARSSIANVTLTNSAGAIDTNKIKLIGQTGSNIKPEIKKVERAAVAHYEKLGFAAVAAVICAESLFFIGRTLYRRALARRTAVAQAAISGFLQRPAAAFRLLVATAALVLVGNAVYTALPLSNRHDRVVPDPVFIGTALQGSQLKGPLKFVVDAVAPQISDIIENRNRFYQLASDNQRAAFKARYGMSELAHPAGAARIVFADDFQGVSGMEQLVGQAARMSDVSMIVVGGDTSFSGTEWETPSVDTLRYYAGKVPIFANLGRHDTPAIAKLMHHADITVADGQIHTVAGVTMLGANDPYVAPSFGIGGVDRLRDRSVTQDTLIADMIAKACKEHPTVFTVHDRVIGDAVAKTGCARIVLTGREYDIQRPISYTSGLGTTVELISGSTGGHGSGDGPEITVPHNNATFQVLTVKKNSGGILADEIHTLHPDASYDIVESSYFTSPDDAHEHGPQR
jgi:hypothetical protein